MFTDAHLMFVCVCENRSTLHMFTKIGLSRETLWMNRDFMKFIRESYGHSFIKSLQDFIEDKEKVQSLNLNNSSQLKTF